MVARGQRAGGAQPVPLAELPEGCDRQGAATEAKTPGKCPKKQGAPAGAREVFSRLSIKSAFP
jgi:hypothetical protein